MSMRMSISCKCAVCGAESQQRFLTSTSTFGPPDLDLRPSEMQRSTMRDWVQECPECGYVAPRIDASTSITPAALRHRSYVDCSGIRFQSDLARRFYRRYLLARAQEDTRGAFHGALYAAWACDDCEDVENAYWCRKLAVAEIEKLIAEAEDPEELLVQKADLLRRAGFFSRMLEEYAPLTFRREQLARIVAFQMERARQKDDRCYTLADVKQ